jgi:hypothetical protein
LSLSRPPPAAGPRRLYFQDLHPNFVDLPARAIFAACPPTAPAGRSPVWSRHQAWIGSFVGGGAHHPRADCCRWTARPF